MTAYYQVSATNSHGEGPRSTLTSGKTFSVPSEPRNVVAEQGFGTVGGVQVSWQLPLEDGGGPLSYRVCKRSSQTGPETCANTGNSFYHDSGNIPIVGTYYYTVAAFNVVGQGPASQPVCSRAFPTPPLGFLASC